MAEHSPGPWSALPDDMALASEPQYLIRAANGRDVAITLSDNDEADARLIASAPALKEQRDALLEACYAAETVMRDDDDYSWDVALDMLRAAIAKAEGDDDAR